MLVEANDPKIWNGSLLSRPSQAGIFLQSWEWGEFQESVGRQVYRLVNSSQSAVHSAAQVIELPLPFGKKYWFIPRGTLIDGIIEKAKKHGAIFVRMEPLQKLRPPSSVLRPTKSVSPMQTLLIDLAQSEEELLAAMHEKTRYNIRLALRRGVEIRDSRLEIRDDFEKFWKLLEETAKRDKFRTHERGYYEKILEILGDSRLEIRDSEQISNIQSPISNRMHMRLHIAYSDSTPLAAAMVGYFGDTATYLHGASSYAHRALMGPYALHWQIMQEVKKEGYKFYDFWGIHSPSPSMGEGGGEGVRDWSGMTRFKMGFGGKVVNYPGTFDLPLSQFWYMVYRLGRNIF